MFQNVKEKFKIIKNVKVSSHSYVQKNKVRLLQFDDVNEVCGRKSMSRTVVAS